MTGAGVMVGGGGDGVVNFTAQWVSFCGDVVVDTVGCCAIYRGRVVAVVCFPCQPYVIGVR